MERFFTYVLERLPEKTAFLKYAHAFADFEAVMEHFYFITSCCKVGVLLPVETYGLFLSLCITDLYFMRKELFFSFPLGEGVGGWGLYFTN